MTLPRVKPKLKTLSNPALSCPYNTIIATPPTIIPAFQVLNSIPEAAFGVADMLGLADVVVATVIEAPVAGVVVVALSVVVSTATLLVESVL